MGINMKSFKTDRIIFAAGALVIGVILLVWPSTSLLIMGKCIGAFLAGGGLVAAFMFFRNHDSALKSMLLVMAAVMMICGIVIFLHPDDLVRLIPTIMGILVLLSGLLNLGETFLLTRSRYSKWWISLLVAAATIAAGVFLIRNAFNLAALITRIAGGVLIFDGLSKLWVISRISKAEKDMMAEASAVDAAATVTGEEAVQPHSAQPEKETGTYSAPDSAVPAEDISVPSEEGKEKDGEGFAAHSGDNGTAAGADSIPDVPEYLKQTEQDTDYSAFAGADPAEVKADNDKPGE